MSAHKNLRGRDLHAPSSELIENNTGATISALSVVSLAGMGANFPQVVLNNPNLNAPFGIVQDDILAGKAGTITVLGFMFGIDTSAWIETTVLYSDASGMLSSAVLGAPIAYVIKQDASFGVLYTVVGTAFSSTGDAAAWDVDGNAGLSNSNYIGTNDATPLNIKTNNNQVAKFDVNGRLALGAHAPDAPLHIKSYPGYTGSGYKLDTFSVTSSTSSFASAYTATLVNGQTLKMKFQTTCRQSDGAERASFTRSILVYKEGGNLMMVGPDWTSDFTAKSDNNFEVDYSLGVSDLTIMIRNANAIDTYWTGHVEIEVIADAT